MRILPISNSNIYHPSYTKSEKTDKISFAAHPDFYKFNSTQSCYFRRGMYTLVNEHGYAQLEKLFKQIFEKQDASPKEMLIIGIGHSQEPFSYLASIKGILSNRSLGKNIDLYTVDLQSAPELPELKRDAICDLHDYEKFPKYAGKSFVKDTFENWLGEEHYPKSSSLIELYIYKQTHIKPKLHDRVNDEVFDFLWSSYNNPSKSKWDTRIQDAILGYPDNKFKIISANNVLPYITDEKQYIDTLANIKRTLKHDGYLITDPYDFLFEPYSKFMENIEKVDNGIYKKI